MRGRNNFGDPGLVQGHNVFAKTAGIESCTRKHFRIPRILAMQIQQFRVQAEQSTNFSIGNHIYLGVNNYARSGEEAILNWDSPGY